jgi:hypothetical protein
MCTSPIFLPIFPRFYTGDTHLSMRKYLYMAAVILLAVVLLVVFILIAESLNPGFQDPNTGQLRYISDGFADHRPYPWICLALIIIIVTFMLEFGWTAARHVSLPPFTGFSRIKEYRMWMILIWAPMLFVSGFLTALGFAILTAQPTGDVHYIGAALFILSHIALQLVFLHIIWHIIPPNVWMEGRWSEYIGITMAVVGAIVFAAFMSSSSSTVSAAAEYFVFLAFIILNVLASAVITYIAVEFEPEVLEVSDRGKIRNIVAWVHKKSKPTEKVASAILCNIDPVYSKYMPIKYMPNNIERYCCTQHAGYENMWKIKTNC